MCMAIFVIISSSFPGLWRKYYIQTPGSQNLPVHPYQEQRERMRGGKTENGKRKKDKQKERRKVTPSQESQGVWDTVTSEQVFYPLRDNDLLSVLFI